MNAFGLLTIQLVGEACARGSVINVRSIETSPDPRPLPMGIRDALAAAALGASPTRSAFSDGAHDYFTIVASLTEDAVPEPGIDGRSVFGDIALNIDIAPSTNRDDVRVVVCATRRTSWDLPAEIPGMGASQA